MVDAGDHHVGPAPLQDQVEADVDGVGGRAVHREAARRHLVEPERPVERDGVGGGRLLPVRRADPDLVALEGRGQGPQPGGVDAVVVGEEHSHRAASLPAARGWASTRTPFRVAPDVAGRPRGPGRRTPQRNADSSPSNRRSEMIPRPHTAGEPRHVHTLGAPQAHPGAGVLQGVRPVHRRLRPPLHRAGQRDRSAHRPGAGDPRPRRLQRLRPLHRRLPRAVWPPRARPARRAPGSCPRPSRRRRCRCPTARGRRPARWPTSRPSGSRCRRGGRSS